MCKNGKKNFVWNLFKILSVCIQKRKKHEIKSGRIFLSRDSNTTVLFLGLLLAVISIVIASLFKLLNIFKFHYRFRSLKMRTTKININKMCSIVQFFRDFY